MRILQAFVVVAVIAMAGLWYATPNVGDKIAYSIVGEQFNAPYPLGAPDGSPYAAGYPKRGVEAEKKPLGTPAALSASSGNYTFIGDDGAFVAYDPCRPIHYVTRPDNAPPGGQQLISEAVAAASAATGLVFIDDGPTTEGFSEDRMLYQPDRYGKKWAPVLFVWETTQEEPRFSLDRTPGTKNLAGLGGSHAIVGDAGSRVFVTGTVQLSAPVFQDRLSPQNSGGDEARRIAGGIIQHEIGHVLGLGHVQDPTQLMYEYGQNEVTTYADGDLTGLAKLGQGQCYANH